MTGLRLLTYNVRSLRDDPAAVARVIRSAAPDVVCVQESPRKLRWRSKCAALARTSGLVVVGGGGPPAANLLLSTLSVDVDAVHVVDFTRDPQLFPRGAVIALLRLRGTRFAVAGTHLDTADEPRLRHIAELDAALARLVPPEVPVLVAGDVNAYPDSPAWTALTAARTDAFAAAGTGSPFTSTAADPYQTIDGIFADPRVSVRAARVLDGPDVAVASDHRPVLAEFDLPD